MEGKENKTVVNRWNNRKYLVVGQKDDMVTLKRDDGTTFTIQKSELAFSYCEKTLKKVPENA